MNTQHPRYPEALRLAAGYFLSSLPHNMTGREIVAALEGCGDDPAKLPNGLRLWSRLNLPPSEVAGNITNLASHFVEFSGLEPVSKQSDDAR